jgi:hypothetical protein
VARSVTDDVLYFMPRRKNVPRRESHREVTPLGEFDKNLSVVLQVSRGYLRGVDGQGGPDRVHGQILKEALGAEKPHPEPNLAEAIRRRFLPLGGADEIEPHPPVLVGEPPLFER